MSVASEYEEWLKELMDPLGDVTFRRMFGGIGIFRHGLMFALCTSDGHLAFKADEATIPDFENASCTEWKPQRPGRAPVSMGYWHVPEYLCDDPDEFAQWAQRAFEAAARIDRKKPPLQRKLRN